MTDEQSSPTKQRRNGMMSNCSCMEIAGEDPRCIRHGKGTQWAKENPDLCEISERLTTMQAREATLIRDARSAGFDAAVLTIEQWAPGFYSDDTRRKLEAIVCDLRRVKDEALGTSGLATAPALQESAACTSPPPSQTS
jgi:hypothetical protein